MDNTKLIKNVFSTPQGQELLKVFRKTLYDRPVYRVGQDLAETAFREGQRDVVSQIMRSLDAKET